MGILSTRNERERMSEEEDDKRIAEMQTTFRNMDAREYTAKITVPICISFCSKYNIKMEGFNPLNLNIGQLIDLAYECTRSSKTRAQNETREEFLGGLDGEAFSLAQEVTTNAMVNFSLRTMPKDQAKILRTQILFLIEAVEKSEEGDQSEQNQSEEENTKSGTSSESVEV